MLKKFFILLTFTKLCFCMGDDYTYWPGSYNSEHVKKMENIFYLEEAMARAIIKLSIVCKKNMRYEKLIDDLPRENTQKHELLEKYLNDVSQEAAQILQKDASGLRFEYLADEIEHLRNLRNLSFCVIL